VLGWQRPVARKIAPLPRGHLVQPGLPSRRATQLTSFAQMAEIAEAAARFSRFGDFFAATFP